MGRYWSSDVLLVMQDTYLVQLFSMIMSFK